MSMSRLQLVGGAMALLLAGGLIVIGVQRNTAAAQQGASAAAAAAPPAAPSSRLWPRSPGMPPVVDARNLYSETAAGKISPALAGDLERIYVPNLRSNDVYVVDPAAMKVVDRFKVGIGPQHIVPSWDLRTLWVTNNAEGRTDGSLTPIDPKTGKPGSRCRSTTRTTCTSRPTASRRSWWPRRGSAWTSAIRRRWRCSTRSTCPAAPASTTPTSAIDGRFAIFTCEFSGTLVKIDLVDRKVLGYLKLQMPATRFKEVPGAPRAQAGKVWEPGETELCTVTKGMPQDIRSSPDGKRFYIADMHADGVHIVDGASFTQVGFIATGLGAHGLYPSRDGKRLYVANRGSHKIHGVAPGQWRCRGDRLRHREGRGALGRPWRRQPRHGQRQRRWQVPVARGALRRRDLPLRHRTVATSRRSRSAPSRMA